jgi:superoxide dismutase, Cu-Zn family
MTFRRPRHRRALDSLAACLASFYTAAAGAGTAVLEPANGSNVKGEVTFSQDGPRVRATGEITGLTPGRHGLHLHDKGDCGAPHASSAAGHYNAEGRSYGDPQSAENPIGEIGNVTANRSGAATVDSTLTGISLASLMGKGLVVQAGAKDDKARQAGNPGALVACGVVK